MPRFAANCSKTPNVTPSPSPADSSTKPTQPSLTQPKASLTPKSCSVKPPDQPPTDHHPKAPPIPKSSPMKSPLNQSPTVPPILKSCLKNTASSFYDDLPRYDYKIIERHQNEEEEPLVTYRKGELYLPHEDIYLYDEDKFLPEDVAHYTIFKEDFIGRTNVLIECDCRVANTRRFIVHHYKRSSGEHIDGSSVHYLHKSKYPVLDPKTGRVKDIVETY